MEQQLADLAATIQASMGTLVEIKPMVAELVGWKPTVEKAVADLREEMGALRGQVQQIARNPVLAVKPTDLPPLLPTPSGAQQGEAKVEAEQTPTSEAQNGPSGHREANIFRGKAVGNESLSLSLSGKGASSFSPQFPHVFDSGFHSGRFWGGGYHGGSSRVDCPVFDGESPRDWQFKCSFACAQLTYLGHVISAAGVSIDPKNIAAVMCWAVPNNVREVRGFLGLAGYYRKFVRHFGVVSHPLTDLLKKNVVFVWTSEHQAAFDALKLALTSAPVLALPDFSKTFVIEMDASEKGVGAVLMQDGHPLAFLSKSLGPRNQGLSTYEKECLAILLAVDHWRSYLQFQEFVIRTDQRSLIHLGDQRLATPWQQMALTKLLGLQYRLVYKKGADNRAADALSRCESPEILQLSALSVCVPTWLDEVTAGYVDDPHTRSLMAQVLLKPASFPQYTVQDGVLRYKGRIWLGANSSLELKVLNALHAGAVGGHSGVQVTYTRLKRLFAWPGLKKSVIQFVEACFVCKQAKAERVRYPGLLQPLPVPEHAWQMVTLNFIEGLPVSSGFDCILVVVDKFSRYAHFIALAHPFTAFDVAMAYLQNVYKLHGLPQAIVSDRDRIFTSALWTELFKLADTQLRMSSAYHPQTDGQTERVNQCLETFLRCFVHACPCKWFRWLALAEFWYNTAPHSALGTSPFEVLYGHPPRHFGVRDIAECAVTDLSEWLKERQLITSLLRQSVRSSE